MICTRESHLFFHVQLLSLMVTLQRMRCRSQTDLHPRWTLWLAMKELVLPLEVSLSRSYSYLYKSIEKHPYLFVLQRHEGHGSFIQWQYWFLWQCRWSLARKYIDTISVHNLPRLHSVNVNRSLAYRDGWWERVSGESMLSACLADNYMNNV